MTWLRADLLQNMRKLLYIICLSTLWTCKKDTTTTVDLGYDYFPINVGSTWIYQVDSLVYFGSGNDTLVSFEEKIVVDSFYVDDTQDTVYMMSRYKNNVIQKVYTVKKLKTRLEQRENNIEIKLLFPVREGQSWNLHSFSALDSIEVHYDNVGKAFSKDTLVYDNTCSVVLEDVEVFLDELSSLEVYSKGEGLVFLEQKNFINQPNKNGYWMTKRLKQYIP